MNEALRMDTNDVGIVPRVSVEKGIFAKKQKFEEDPWHQRVISIRRHTDKSSVKKEWTIDVARSIYDAFRCMCILSGKPIDIEDTMFVKKDVTEDLTPLNAVLVSKLLSKRRHKDSFAWNDEQLERIRKAHKIFKIEQNIFQMNA